MELFVFLLCIVVLIAGYSWGKKNGKKESSIFMTFHEENGDYTVEIKADKEKADAIIKALKDFGIDERRK